MPGLDNALNIAKGSLLAQQIAMQVISHNVANVDTPGFTRQSISLVTNPASPDRVGLMGNGVTPQSVFRQYDQFMTQKIMNQQSTLSNLEAQKDSMSVIETIFNEASGLGLNDLMSQFWSSWQDLANNPELLSSRQSVIQKGQMLSDYFSSMNSQISQARNDFGVKLSAAIDDVNNYCKQIAELNVQITSVEGPERKANDLRDTRDQTMRKLSELIDVTYFESGSGAYTVLLTDGHPLVETNESWNLKWENDALSWVGKSKSGTETTTPIGTDQDVGGKIGGWLSIQDQLLEGDPSNYLGRLDALANALIREVNQQHSQGVGFGPFTETLTGTEAANDTVRLNTMIDAADAARSIEANAIEINGEYVGAITGTLATNGLAMGKAYNAAVAINAANAEVTARNTTLVAGNAITAGLAFGESAAFTVNGVDISYDSSVLLVTDPDETPAVTAAGVVAAANAAFTAAGMTIEAVVGDGANGGALNSIVFRNTNKGDESKIIIEGVDSADPAEAKLKLTDGTYSVDATHNTGELTLFSLKSFSVVAGGDDLILDQLNLGGGGIGDNDVAGDGQLIFTYAQGGVANAIQGLRYTDELNIDDGGFSVWLYDRNGNLALAQPVTISTNRVYQLGDIVDAFNLAMVNAGAVDATGQPWVAASMSAENKLVLTPDADHAFAFAANDTAHALQVLGLNTFFTGYNVSTIGVNDLLTNDLSLIAAGQVNDYGEIFRGDNTNATAISNLQRNEYITFKDGSIGNFDEFYNNLVSTVGFDTRSAKSGYEMNLAVTNQLDELRDSFSGVSLDEEMANLMKTQQAYAAAAKIITTSDEMIQVLLAAVTR